MKKKFIGFYVTPVQYRKIKQAAEKSRRPVSQYIRLKLLEEKKAGNEF